MQVQKINLQPATMKDYKKQTNNQPAFKGNLREIFSAPQDAIGSIAKLDPEAYENSIKFLTVSKDSSLYNLFKGIMDRINRIQKEGWEITQCLIYNDKNASNNRIRLRGPNKATDIADIDNSIFFKPEELNIVKKTDIKPLTGSAKLRSSVDQTGEMVDTKVWLTKRGVGTTYFKID